MVAQNPNADPPLQLNRSRLAPDFRGRCSMSSRPRVTQSVQSRESPATAVLPAHGARRQAGAAAGRRERVLFLIGVGVIAVHVLDDSFVQPNPGTSAGDHLVSGLVPLALLGLAVALHPRVGAGARAAIALLAGLFGIVAGLEGWHYTLKVGPSGDDFTGLLALPAGVVLLVIAVVTLWTSRRLDQRLVRRYLRRALIGIAGLFVLIVLVAPVLYAYGLTHLARAVVPEAELGASYEDVTFTTSDGLELEGWYIPSKNQAAVISFPGRAGTQKQARMLADHGYGVLLFDRRGEGESDGDPNSLGWGGYRDVDAAVEFLRERADVDPERIGGIGRSVGGEMLIEAAARSDGLKAVVSEGAGIRSVREAADSEGGDNPLGLAMWGMITAGITVFADHSVPPNLQSLTPRIAPRPVFLIFATKGQGGEDLSRDYYEAAREPKVLWEISAGGHVGGIDARPRQYEERVTGFFDRFLRR
jgi:uncharacterized protein